MERKLHTHETMNYNPGGEKHNMMRITDRKR